mgnify:CR=1 FL=1
MKTFTRYGLNGLFFTFLGPALFWLLYPLGPLRAWLFVELGCHILRYISFRLLVFPRSHGFHVSLIRYLIAWIPTALSGFLSVALLREILGRIQLTLVGAAIGISVGFFVNLFLYRKS